MTIKVCTLGIVYNTLSTWIIGQISCFLHGQCWLQKTPTIQSLTLPDFVKGKLGSIKLALCEVSGEGSPKGCLACNLTLHFCQRNFPRLELVTHLALPCIQFIHQLIVLYLYTQLWHHSVDFRAMLRLSCLFKHIHLLQTNAYLPCLIHSKY